MAVKTAENKHSFPSVLETACAYVAAGISAIPIRRDGTKAPAIAWKVYQDRLATENELQYWFGRAEPYGLALIGGDVSGSLEQLDFDHNAAEIFPAWCQLVEEQCPRLVERLSIAQTPSGGFHVRYRCPDEQIPGNTDLAIDPDGKGHDRILIQTRGEGGYALAPGCPAKCHETGRPYVQQSGPHIPPTVTPDEREVLWTCARSFTREVKEQTRPVGADMRPGEDYDRRGPDWAEILGPFDWCCAFGSPSGERRWRRPGKERGWSATTGVCKGKDGCDLFRVFTSSAPPFEDGPGYGKFRAFALLNHGGNLSKAADELARQGYGSRAGSRGQNNSVPVPPYRGRTGTESSEGAQADPAKPLNPIPFSGLKAVAPDACWIWQDYIARRNATMKSALFKAGKTTLDAHLLKALGQDGEFCGKRIHRSRVLIVTEEHESRWAERRDKLGIGDYCEALVRPFSAKPSYEEWRRFLGQLAELQSNRNYDLIVFDTLANLWPVANENDASEVQAALMPLHHAMGDAALVLDHHFRKSDGGEGTASRGSGALHAWVDIIIEMRRYDSHNRKDRRRVLTAYGRLGDPDELVIELSEDGSNYTSHGDKQHCKRNDLRNTIRQILSGRSKTIDEIQEALPDGQRTHKQKLLVELQAGLDADPPDWLRHGAGKKGSPHVYSLPNGSSEPNESPGSESDLEEVLHLFNGQTPTE